MAPMHCPLHLPPCCRSAAALLLLCCCSAVVHLSCVQGTGLIDLMTPIGELACKVPPSVDLVKVMGRLTGTLTRLE
jgi:hypothetical protein